MNLKNLLTLFGLRDLEIIVYETLWAGSILSASELAKRAGISRTSVYDVLERLQTTGLITETLKGGIKQFAVQPPEKLQLLLVEKEQALGAAKQLVHTLEQNYKQKQVSAKPRLQMFEGKTELQQMMKDLLLYRDITVQAYWPVKKMLELLTPEFMDHFHRERTARNIQLQVIWPVGQAPSAKAYRFLGTEKELKREVRIAPVHTDFTLGYSVYGRTVRFISSSKENFGFLVESEELAEMMRTQFKILWHISKPLKSMF